MFKNLFKKNQATSYFFLAMMVICLFAAIGTSGTYPRALAFLLSAFASAELVVEFSEFPDEKKDDWNRALKGILFAGSIAGAILFHSLA